MNDINFVLDWICLTNCKIYSIYRFHLLKYFKTWFLISPYIINYPINSWIMVGNTSSMSFQKIAVSNNNEISAIMLPFAQEITCTI